MARYGDDGACGRDRTADPRFTRAVLCQLSYASVHGGRGRIRTSEPGKGRFYRPLRLATPPRAQGNDTIAHDACHWQASYQAFFVPYRVPLGWHVVPHVVTVTPSLWLASPWELVASHRSIAMPTVRRPARMRHASNEIGRSGARCFMVAALGFLRFPPSSF